MTSVKQERRVKLCAKQTLFYDLDIIREGEVFVFEGDELPSEHVAVRVSADTPLGPMPEPPPSLSQSAPVWTTKGFVDGRNREIGRRADLDELFD
jgi:hypothetical protein